MYNQEIIKCIKEMWRAQDQFAKAKLDKKFNDKDAQRRLEFSKGKVEVPTRNSRIATLAAARTVASSQLTRPKLLLSPK